MIRFGLCCIFREAPIKFRRTTARYLGTLDPDAGRRRLADLCRHNARSLQQALAYCCSAGIGAFRINSQILPLKTHPAFAYDLAALPGGADIVAMFRDAGRYARDNDIRTSFHPDQFILLSSPDRRVISRSVADLVYQAEVAQWVGADVINIHAGGVYGDKPTALARLAANVQRLPQPVRSRLTLENDDRSYTVTDLLPVCRRLEVPLVYDVHHHRCLADGLNEAQATREVLTTWNREPLFHLSSPAAGWRQGDPRPHHDYIDPADVPPGWRDLNITVEVEAKAKELAVKRLMRDLGKRGSVAIGCRSPEAPGRRAASGKKTTERFGSRR
jgi:UV DNA damage endonuclease